jgi:hypothetical protein
MLQRTAGRVARRGVGILSLGLTIMAFLAPIGVALLVDAIHPGTAEIFERKLAWIAVVLAKTICT